MLEQAQRVDPAVSRDDLRLLPTEERDRLRATAIRLLPVDCILDVHLSTRVASGLEPALPRELRSKRLGVVAILQADPQIILARRMARSGRKDPNDSAHDIVMQQAFNLEVAQELDCKSVVLIDASRPTSDVAEQVAAAFAV